MTGIFPILFSIISLIYVKKATNSKRKTLKKVIVAADIIPFAFIVLAIVLGVMGMI